MTQKTVLNDAHRRLGARMVDFGGWDMPLNYGSQIDEHHQVRRDAGMFDVSHMTVVDLSGERCRDFLRHLVANNVDRLKGDGRALYTCMLNADGGVIDDLIVYRRGDNDWRLVVNAATRDKDLAWIAEQAAAFDVVVMERPELAMIAVQGPNARDKAMSVLPESERAAIEALPRFAAHGFGDWFVARTGYTGEDGFEIVLPESEAEAFWQALLDAGVQPAGLGARDTLRLEAGMNLYGQDMDAGTSPLVSGLGWTVAFEPADRQFRGRAALEKQKAEGVSEKLTGLVLEDRGIMRHGQRVITAAGEGIITSGGFSPTMERSIALARLPVAATGSCQVDIRGVLRKARIVKPPFVRLGRILVDDAPVQK